MIAYYFGKMKRVVSYFLSSSTSNRRDNSVDTNSSINSSSDRSGNSSNSSSGDSSSSSDSNRSDISSVSNKSNSSSDSNSNDSTCTNTRSSNSVDCSSSYSNKSDNSSSSNRSVFRSAVMLTVSGAISALKMIAKSELPGSIAIGVIETVNVNQLSNADNDWRWFRLTLACGWTVDRQAAGNELTVDRPTISFD